MIWSSDLRGFTRLSDHLPAERVIRILNELFDLQAKAITAHGGEILKFVGDGLLAIFPVASPAELARAAANALAAAKETLAALREQTPPEGEPPLEIVVALHYGTVIYGNVGSADRLDFTVIGPAVNLVSRIEAVAKSLDLRLVVSDDFADAYGERLTSLGDTNCGGSISRTNCSCRRFSRSCPGGAPNETPVANSPPRHPARTGSSPPDRRSSAAPRPRPRRRAPDAAPSARA